MPGEEDAAGRKNDRCGALGKEQTEKRQALYGQKERCGGGNEKAEEKASQENDGYAAGHRTDNGERRGAEEFLQWAVFFVGAEDLAGAAENRKEKRAGKQEGNAQCAHVQEAERRREALHFLHLFSQAKEGAGSKGVLPPLFRHHCAEKRPVLSRGTNVDEECVVEGGRIVLRETCIGKHCLQSEELLLPRAVGCAENRRELP